MSRSAALLLVARLTSALTTLAMLSAVARLRGPEALGLVALGLASGAILAVLSDAGTGSLLVREAAREPHEADRMVGGILMARFVTVPFVLACAWVVIGLALHDAAPVAWLAAAGLVFQQWADLGRAVSLSRRRVDLVAAHSLVENVAWLVVIVALLLAGASLTVVLAGGLLVFVISIVAGLVLVRVALGVRPAMPSPELARRLARDATPFALNAVLATAHTRIDTILVGLLVSGPALVLAGAYFASTRLVAAFEYLPEAVSRSLLPDLSRGYVTDPARLSAILRRPARFLVFVGVPIPFAMIVSGGWLIETLFGETIGPYGWVLVPLAALVPLRFLALLFGAVLTSTNEQWRRAAAAGTALAALTALDIVLLPRLGIIAAVAGAAGATFIVVGIYAAGVSRLVGSLFLLADAGLAIVAAGVAVAIGLAARAVVPDPFAGGIFAVVYLFALVLLVRLFWAPSPRLGGAAP